MSSTKKTTVSDLLKISDYHGAYNLMAQNGDDPEKILDYLSTHYFQNSKAKNNNYWSFIASNNKRFDHYNTESFILSLSKYFKKHDDPFKSLIVEVSERYPEVLIQSVRYSGFFLDAKHRSWDELDFLKYHPSLRISDLNNSLIKISQVNTEYLNKSHFFRKKLSHLSVYQIVGYIALYSAKYITPLDLINKTGDSDGKEKFHFYVEALTDILKEKLESINQFPSSDYLFKDTFLSIIKMIPCENSSVLVEELKKHPERFSNIQDLTSESFAYLDYKLKNESEFLDFEQYVSHLIDYNYFKASCVDTFCYDINYNFSFENGKVVLTYLDIDIFNKWMIGGKKIHLNTIYFLNQAIEQFIEFGFDKQTFGAKERDLENKNAFINALATSLMMSEIFGIENITNQDGTCSVDYFSFAHNFNSLNRHFQHDFIKPLLLSLKEYNNDYLMALKNIQEKALKEKFADRFIIRIYDVETLVSMIERNLKMAPQNNEDTGKQAHLIIQKLTWNLNSQNHKNKSLAQTPILKIKNQYIIIPWIFGYLNMDTILQNAILELEKNKPRKKEGEVTDQKITKLMEEIGFKAKCNVEYNENKTNSSGEIDILAYKDGHLFILEKKSTYLRVSFRDAWLHRVTGLKKGGEQLVKINNWVRNNYNEVSDMLGLSEKLGDLIIHSWIIDTSFEFDHEYINGFLKISLLEFIIALTNKKMHLLSPVDLLQKANLPIDVLQAQGLTSDILEILDVKNALNLMNFDLYKGGGFSVERFVDIIENEEVWSGIIKTDNTLKAPVYKC